MTNPDSPTAKYQESFGADIVQNSKFHINLAQEVIVITEDKLRLCLQSHVDRLSAKERWVAPVSLFITFVVVFGTSTFNNVVLPAATWQAIFVLSALASGTWSIVSVKNAVQSSATLDTLVAEVKRTSEQLKAQ